MRIALLLAMAGFLLASCKKQDSAPEQTYQGQKESRWLELTGDADVKTKKSAYRAIAHIPTKACESKLREGLADRDARCISAGFFAQSNPNDAISALKQELKDNEYAPCNNGDFKRAIYDLGTRARELVPTIKAIREGTKDGSLKSCIDIFLEDMPGA